jgi:predicted permease
MNSFLQDIRYGIRTLAAKPAFTALAMITLALGIGASTAIFSVMNVYFLRPIAGRDNSRLVTVGARHRTGNPSFVSYPDFKDYRDNTNVFSAMTGYMISFVGFTADGHSDRPVTNFVPSNFFATMGLDPALGRFLLPGEGDDAPNAPVAILGYAYWQQRFAGNLNVIGRAVQINGRAFTIDGVTPREFRGPYALVTTQLYLPVGMFDALNPGSHTLTTRDDNSLIVLAQPKPGVDREQVRAAMQVVAERLDREYPTTNKETKIEIYPERLARPQASAATINVIAAAIFISMVGLALLVTCVNVANLILVRASGRARELAIRVSLGAGRGRIVRQLITESLLLSLFGGVIGGVLGFWLSRAISSVRPTGSIPIYFDFNFDWHVFAYLAFLVGVCGVIVGIVPAWRCTRVDLNSTLREGGRSDGGASGRSRLRNVFVVAQVSASLVVLIAAALFVRSGASLERADIGFDPGNLLIASADPASVSYDAPRTEAFYRALKGRVLRTPGVESASYAGSIPMGYNIDSAYLWKEGQAPAEWHFTGSDFTRVDEDYFRTMRIPITRGRAFNAQDTKDSVRVAIINQKLAERLWPGQDPLGHHFRYPAGDSPAVEVVGVVPNGKYNWLFEEGESCFYVPLAQDGSSLRMMEIRTLVAPSALATQVENAARGVDPNIPLFDVMTMDESLGGANGYFLSRLATKFSASLGALCLLLAIVGVYGVISYAAGQRTHEIGIRMALGAERGRVLWMVLRQGLALVCVGLAIGLAISFGVTRFMTGILYHVGATDPVAFAVVSLIMLGVAMFACYIPARRATRVDPLVALRNE